MACFALGYEGVAPEAGVGGVAGVEVEGSRLEPREHQ